MLYIEQPAGVGYSYCDKTKVPKECIFEDNNVSVDNLHAILGWFEKFPEFKNHELYISGESYGGIYVPYMLWQLHHHNIANLGNNVFKPNVKGFMVGNGVTNWKYDTDPGAFEMSYWHSITSTEDFEAWNANKCSFNMPDPMP